MKPIIFIIRTTFIIFIGACTTTNTAPLPTLAVLPTVTVTSSPAPAVIPTMADVPADTSTPTATITDTPIPVTIPSTSTPTPSRTATTTPFISPTPLPAIFSFGRSADGRDLLAYRYGSGHLILLLIGGIHAGFEANTIELVEALRAHYERYPADIQADVQIVLIPSLNPDGATYGRQLRGRFNGNEIDLNRNWPCDWSPDARFGDRSVNAGEAPLSEPESLALASLIQEIRPSSVIFYHGASNGVFDGRCGGLFSVELARVYGEVSGYPYGDAFGDYRVTGSAPAWVNSLGIPAIDVELATSTGTEFSRNLRAVNAIQTWLRNP